MNEKVQIKRVRRPADYQLHLVLDHEEVVVICAALEAFPADDNELGLELRDKFNNALATLGERLKK